MSDIIFMQIKFEFQQHQDLTIEILDIPILKVWFENLRSNFYDASKVSCTGIGLTGGKRKNLEDMGYNLDQIHLAASELKKLGYNWPNQIPLISNDPNVPITQQDLNKLHRFFTENWRWCYVRGRKNFNEPNPYDPDFKYPEDLEPEQYYEIIDKINVAVHNLEEYALMEPTKSFLITNSLVPKSIWIQDLDFPVTYLDIEEYLHNYKFDLTADDFPVVLPAHILGKAVIHSFIDNDDPNASDCLGRSEIGLKLLIDINKKRRAIYRSKTFVDWATSYNNTVSCLPLEFCVGKIKDTNLDLDYLNNIRSFSLVLENIKFIN